MIHVQEEPVSYQIDQTDPVGTVLPCVILSPEFPVPELHEAVQATPAGPAVGTAHLTITFGLPRYAGTVSTYIAALVPYFEPASCPSDPECER